MDIKNLISQMTLEEKASMCSGKNLWETQSIERLGIPSITLADGPYGLGTKWLRHAPSEKFIIF